MYVMHVGASRATVAAHVPQSAMTGAQQVG
jgi:hypothetical protein